MRHFIATVALFVAVPACAQPDAATLRPKLEAMAKAGNAEAIYHLGMFYQVGAGVPADHRRALDYFRKAAEAGDPLGAYKVGFFYAGQYEVIEPDEAKALEYKLIAAKAGYALAQQDVAAIYAGRGDIATARDWLAKAAAQGTPNALIAYASIHNGAEGVTPDPAVTTAYFRLALDRIDANEQQQNWLKTFEAKLTPADRVRADKIRAEYRPQPTPLTIKAMSGQTAAAMLVKGGG